MTMPENKQPLVTVGVPAYNGEAYLRECLDSILNQTYPNWECVISNNFSTDRTPEIAQEYCKKDTRFKLVHTSELLPIAENWNFCFTNRSEESKYFKILPADDWIYPAYLQELTEVMERDPAVGIASSYRLVDAKIRADGLRPDEGFVFDGKKILIAQLKREYDVTSSVSAVLYRIDALRRIDLFPHIFKDRPFHMDTYLSYELLGLYNLGFVFQVLSFTRRHEGTVTSKVAHKLNTPLYFRELVLHQYKDLHPDLYKEYRKVRLLYARMLLRERCRMDRKVLQWHKGRLERPIRFSEYFAVMIKRLTFRSL